MVGGGDVDRAGEQRGAVRGDDDGERGRAVRGSGRAGCGRWTGCAGRRRSPRRGRRAAAATSRCSASTPPAERRDARSTRFGTRRWTVRELTRPAHLESTRPAYGVRSSGAPAQAPRGRDRRSDALALEPGQGALSPRGVHQGPGDRLLHADRAGRCCRTCAARPLTLKRYPNGVEEKFFYEKRCPSHRPEWVRTAPVWSGRNEGDIDFCLCEDLPTVVWLANLADLELHTPMARAPEMDHPTIIAFDLDPGPPATIVECARVALELRRAFDFWGLQAFPKTSGSKGMQVYLPLNTPASPTRTRAAFSRGLAQLLERRDPERVVSDMSKAKRTGKVFVDWSQNDRHKTTVNVYSLRAMERPTVSTPLTWDEVEDMAASGVGLAFTSDEVLERVRAAWATCSRRCRRSSRSCRADYARRASPGRARRGRRARSACAPQRSHMRWASSVAAAVLVASARAAGRRARSSGRRTGPARRSPATGRCPSRSGGTRSARGAPGSGPCSSTPSSTRRGEARGEDVAGDAEAGRPSRRSGGGRGRPRGGRASSSARRQLERLGDRAVLALVGASEHSR